MKCEINYLSTLQTQALSARHRYCVTLCGELRWATDLIKQWHLTENIETSKVIWLSDSDNEHYLSLATNKGNLILGEESAGLVYDFNCSINANSLSAAAGTVIAGGLCFLIIPPEIYFDKSLFSTWMRHVSPSLVLIEQGRGLPEISQPSKLHQEVTHEYSFGCISSEQQHAVEQIMKVVTGHRKRPLVLTADRGRGKSAALGIAISELTYQRPLNVLVTAPNKRAVDSLFKHLSISNNGSSVTFIAPDELLQQRPKCDLLIVDEAAAIPLSMLESLLTHYHRMVFSTTIHGYEGTGRGFALKFDSVLDIKVPGWKKVSIYKPVRWNVNDPLEMWLFNCFLFGAELDVIDYHQIENSITEVEYCRIDKSELVANGSLFNQVFALLVNAHYQTSPNDMVQLLNDSSLELFVGFHKNQVVCCCIISIEGSLNSKLVESIISGQRRPVGHLLPVSIAQHLNQPDAALQSCARIMRIAVHPSLQNKMLGSNFITYLEHFYQQRDVDYLGTSFGATADLVNFWQRNGFKAVRFGIRRDKASGTHSLMVIKAISKSADHWVTPSVATFDFCLPIQLVEQFRDVDAKVVISLIRQSANHTEICHQQRFLIDGFISQSLGYDCAVPALQVELLYYLSSHCVVSIDEATLFAVEKVLQRKPWKDVIRKYELVGAKQAEQKLRQFALHNLQCKSEG